MLKYLRKLFILPTNAGKMRSDQIDEAELLELDHLALAEDHLALSEMHTTLAAKYHDRVIRLNGGSAKVLPLLHTKT